MSSNLAALQTQATEILQTPNANAFVIRASSEAYGGINNSIAYFAFVRPRCVFCWLQESREETICWGKTALEKLTLNCEVYLTIYIFTHTSSRIGEGV